MFLAERILVLRFWLFVLILGLRVLLMPGSALVLEVGVLDVSLHRFAKLFIISCYLLFFFWGGGVVPVDFSSCEF